MTDFQYTSILKSIKMILRGCKDLEEAQQRIDELLNRDDATEKNRYSS